MSTSDAPSSAAPLDLDQDFIRAIQDAPPEIAQIFEALSDDVLKFVRDPGAFFTWLFGACEEAEASQITGEPTATLQTKRVRGGGPPFTKAGKSVRYIRWDLLAYNFANRRTSTSDPGRAAV